MQGEEFFTLYLRRMLESWTVDQSDNLWDLPRFAQIRNLRLG